MRRVIMLPGGGLTLTTRTVVKTYFCYQNQPKEILSYNDFTGDYKQECRDKCVRNKSQCHKSLTKKDKIGETSGFSLWEYNISLNVLQYIVMKIKVYDI